MVLSNIKMNEIDEVLTETLITNNPNCYWDVKKIINLNEDSKNNLTDKVVTKLFNDIKNKMLDLDYSYVASSKGSFSKLNNFSTISNALKYIDMLIRKSPTKNNDLINAFNTLNYTYNTLLKYENDFISAIRTNNSLAIYLYNSITTAIIQGTSMLVSEGTTMIKNNLGLYDSTITMGTKFEKSNIFKSLSTFNKTEKNGSLKKLLNNISRNKMNEEIGSAIGIIIASVAIFLTCIRSLVFFYYQSRVSLSKHLDMLANFIILHSSTITDNDIKSKQEQIANKLLNLAKIISIDSKVADSKAKDDIDDSNNNISNDTSNSSDTSLDIY